MTTTIVKVRQPVSTSASDVPAATSYALVSTAVSADSAKKLFAFVNTFEKQAAFGEFWTLIRKA